jgi:hypothetical protein
MTISDVGSIGELVGGIATIATLIYLAIQIRENTRLSSRQALDHGVDRLSEWGGRFVDNPEALQLYLDGLEHFESFSDTQKHQYHFIMAEVLMIIEALREHAKNDSIKDETAKVLDPRIQFELRGSGAKAWWKEMAREKFAGDFSAHVDMLLEAQTDA